jgi:hypothetical protein
MIDPVAEVVVWRGRSDRPCPGKGGQTGLTRRSDRPSPDFWVVRFPRS